MHRDRVFEGSPALFCDVRRPVRRPAGSRGRPRDEQLTLRLMEAATGIVATGGLSALTVDSLVDWSNAGRSGIHRRWPTLGHLVVDVVVSLSFDLLPPRTAPTGLLRTDLRVILGRWGAPVSREERFIGAVASAAAYEPMLRDALDHTLLRPLREAVVRVVDASDDDIAPTVVDALVEAVQALWLHRCCVPWSRSAASSAVELVESVLVPIVQAGSDVRRPAVR